MKRVLVALAVVGVFAGPALAGPVHADPAIHEIVAAYCSGGGVGVIDSNGFLEPPPISTFGSPTFARPVLASGAVDPTTLQVTNKPNAKYPAGTNVLSFSVSDSNHPSAANCPNAATLP